MTTSVTQLKANQTNAKKSTGPITEEGKQIVAINAVTHGIFSKHLLLSDESPEDYQLLLDGLQAELKPAGTLEHSLVERIAVSLWRQRRLVRSETAHIELSNRPQDIVHAVNSEMNLDYSIKELSEHDLTDFDQNQYQWCQSVIEEFEQIAEESLTVMDALKNEAPIMYKQLAEDAEQDQESIEDYLKNWDQPLEYFYDLVKYCQDEIKKAEQRPLVLEVAGLVRNKRAILQGITRDILAKYQVMLDNELYKAIKALRETQAWRLDALNGFVLENGTVSGN
ncbi:hypothetical protein [Methyloglobulus sp.]|uniref:hypothetical protein n=1 Tax=Methyloglobulus sp. TaxID=2518622 RepID=UPI003989555A